MNLLWGYTGILSLGQSLFFSLGGYALGMHLMLLIGRLGQYKADIPDFMVFLEFPKRFPETGGLPPHWIPFKHFWFAAIAVVVVTHEAHLASWADRVVFLRDGRVIDQTGVAPGPESLLASGAGQPS